MSATSPDPEGPVLPFGLATGVGSMPGVSVAEATAIVAGELPEFPHLPELPGRGAGSDIVGRTAALLSQVSADLAVDTTPTGWRLAGGATRAARRALSWLRQDSDRCEEVYGGSTGWFKTQLCGPWTLAAAVEAPRGGPALRDPGLVAEIVAALAEAGAAHVADLGRRLPGRRLLLQWDEPSLAAVLDGRIASASGFTMLPAVAPAEAAAVLRCVVAAAPVPAALHCCADFPFAVARAAGFAAVSWDLARTPYPPDAVAEAFEAGLLLMVGAVPTTGGAALEPDWNRIMRLWRDAGLPESDVGRIAVTPACGLAGFSPASARAALAEAVALASRAAGEPVG
jgi:hypothetical protein